VKTVRGIRLSSPDVWGFPDKVKIFNGDAGLMLVYECPRYGTNPNPVNPHNVKQTWKEFEAQLALGKYAFECRITNKHGKCLMLNGGAVCATTNPNYNPSTTHPGTYTAYLVEIHAGFRGVKSGRPWRGSLGCQTVDPDDWPTFISHFELGETGIYELVDEQLMQETDSEKTIIQPL
jgi:hypothetical protein